MNASAHNDNGASRSITDSRSGERGVVRSLRAASAPIQSLRILLIEDSAADAELVLDALGHAGFEVYYERVETEEAFLAALGQPWHMILSDHQLPQFSGIRALELLKTSGHEIPFILISGTIGEETAVAAMRLGASDYLLKDRLGRLGPAILRALEQAHLKQEHRRGVEALRQSEERFRQLAENIHEVFWMTDAKKTEVLYVSPAFEEVWGRPCVHLLETPSLWFEAIVPEDRPRIREVVANRPADGIYDETYRIMRPNGDLRWIRERAFPVWNSSGENYRLVGTAEDITERKQLERQFLRAQRLEAIGTLSSGIAHDLNNILAPVMMITSLIREKLSEPADLELLALVEQSARRGANIIKQLLTFTRGIDGDRGLVQLRHIIREMLGLMRETLPRDIKLVDSVPSDLPPVIADATQMSQVIMNLCVNARDAMPHGGTLTVSAQFSDLSQADMSIHPLAKPGAYVAVSVSDTGHGIPRELVDRIFEPFFTTKESGKGTGLGLSTVAGIAKSHGGFVTVYSETGRGSLFKVYFPVGTTAPAETINGSATEMPIGRQQLVLIVDDEHAIRQSIAQTLERNGYRVLTSSDGRDALTLFLQYRSSIRLLVTDVMMPRMGGLGLIRSVRALEPKLHIVAMSGLNDEDRRTELAELGVSTVLAKPCSPRELLDAAHKELTGT
jgi:PAS domain S-box-containing protein